MADENLMPQPDNHFKNEVQKEQGETLSSQPSPSQSSAQEIPKKETTPSISQVLQNQDRALIVTSRERTLSSFGYIPFLCVLPLALEPNSKFCKFHGKQSLTMVVAFFVLLFVFSVFGQFIWLAWFVYFLLSVLQIVLIIFGFIQASAGKIWRIPFVAEVAEKLDI